MAERRYYWLKLKDDFFTSKRIKKMRRLERGDTCVLIYLKMQLKSLNDGGVIRFTGVEESFEEEIALDVDEDVEDVRRTINFLRDHNLLIEEDETEFTLPFVAENTGSETQAAVRMRRFRGEKQSVAAPKPKKEKSTGVTNANNGEQKRTNENKVTHKPSAESTMDLYERVKGDYQLSGKQDSIMTKWVRYRQEIKKPYKETGMRELIGSVIDYSRMYGEDEVCGCFSESMKNGWQGVFFDKLIKKPVSRAQEVKGWI